MHRYSRIRNLVERVRQQQDAFRHPSPSSRGCNGLFRLHLHRAINPEFALPQTEGYRTKDFSLRR
jgi:hypothetical protein